MSRSSDYHSNHRMHISRKGHRTTPRPTGLNNQDSITNRRGPKTTAQSEKTAHKSRYLELHSTQARTCGIEPTQIPDSLREHNRRQENNKQHEQPTKHENEGGTTTTTRTNKATHTRNSTLPPPKGEWSFMRGGRPRHERKKQNHTTTEEGERGPSTRSDKLCNAN